MCIEVNQLLCNNSTPDYPNQDAKNSKHTKDQKCEIAEEWQLKWSDLVINWTQMLQVHWWMPQLAHQRTQRAAFSASIQSHSLQSVSQWRSNNIRLTDHQWIRHTLTIQYVFDSLCLCVVLKSLSASWLCASGVLQPSRSCCCCQYRQREVVSESWQLTDCSVLFLKPGNEFCTFGLLLSKSMGYFNGFRCLK